MREAPLLLVIALALTAARPAAADLYDRAEEEDRAWHFRDALRDYEEAAARDPANRRAPLARARAADLRAHSEGDFGPLISLEWVRSDPQAAGNAKSIDALVRDAEAFPPGPVRVEAWVLAAEAYAHRLGRPKDALPLYRRVASEPGADPVLARKAARDLVTMLLEDRDLDGARQAAPLGGPDLVRDVARVVRRRSLHYASIAILAVLAGLTAVALRRGGARGIRRALPLALGYAAYLGVVGAALAAGYEAGSGKPFLAFGAALFPVLLAARACGASGSPTAAARAIRGALAASSALAAAFLVLEAVDVAYLEGLGL